MCIERQAKEDSTVITPLGFEPNASFDSALMDDA
jgi:hypothetical protein